MSDVKWIKITTDIFDDEKILLIESMPERDSLIVIWFKLLCMAGKQNNSGVFMLNDKIAYTDEMLATIFRRPLNTVRLALQTFEQFGMVEIIEGVITIPKWEKHQSIDALDKMREQNRLRVAKHREKQKLLSGNVTSNVTVTQCNAIDKNKNRVEKDKNILDTIVSKFNQICISLPKVVKLTDSRKKTINARLNEHSIEDIETVFRKAEASDFLTGKKTNWSADFDWLMKPNNFVKVLEGNYDNKETGYDKSRIVTGLWSTDDDDELPFDI